MREFPIQILWIPLPWKIQFFDPHQHNRHRNPQSIKIGTFNSPHRLLSKIVLQNLWPLVRRSQLVLKRARFLYALIQSIPFCLCKHIVLTMLEMKDDHQVGLPFGCLVTRICQQLVPNIPALKSVTKPEDSFGKHTVMKFNAQHVQIHRKQSLFHQLLWPCSIPPLLLPHKLLLLLLLRRCFPELWANCRLSSNNIWILMPEWSKSTSMSSNVCDDWSRMMMSQIECFDHSFYQLFMLVKLLFLWTTVETFCFYSCYFEY